MATIIYEETSEGKRRCDARCHQARDTNCRCICGGAYHGCARGFDHSPSSIEEAEMMLIVRDQLAFESAWPQQAVLF